MLKIQMNTLINEGTDGVIPDLKKIKKLKVYL